jgi:hypothetical protein
MHLAVLADWLCDTIEGCFTVYSDCHIRAQVTILEEAFLDPRKTLLQVIDDGAYRPPGHTHL